MDGDLLSALFAERKSILELAVEIGDLARVATARESLAMQRELERCMASGAIGLSTGLAYPTARAASTEEVVGLAKVAASAGGIYTTHLRDEFDHILDALDGAL